MVEAQLPCPKECSCIVFPSYHSQILKCHDAAATTWEVTQAFKALAQLALPGSSAKAKIPDFEWSLSVFQRGILCFR